MSRLRPLRAALALTTGVAALVLAASPAFAHVEASGAAGAGGATQVTFSFTHGCGTSPTTSLRVQLPAGTTDVRADAPAGFTSTVSATEVAWTGGSIPTDTPGSFTATMTLAGKAGDVVYLPTIQGCATGEEAWIDKTPDAEAEHAAPRITLGAAETSTTEAADHDHDASASTTTGAPTTATTATPTTAAVTTTAKAASTTTSSAPPSTTTSSSSNIGLIVAAIVVALLVIGGVVTALQRRKP